MTDVEKWRQEQETRRAMGVYVKASFDLAAALLKESTTKGAQVDPKTQRIVDLSEKTKAELVDLIIRLEQAAQDQERDHEKAADKRHWSLIMERNLLKAERDDLAREKALLGPVTMELEFVKGERDDLNRRHNELVARTTNQALAILSIKDTLAKME
jgi:hypothetical protein